MEQFAVEILLSSGFKVGEASELAADRSRQGFSSPFLEQRLYSAIERLNRSMHGTVVADTLRFVQSLPFASLIENNRHFHDFLTNGVPVEYKDAATGDMRGGARAIDRL